MATGIGHLSYCGAIEQAAYRTPLDVTNKIPFVSESITEDIARIENDILQGTAGRAPDEAGPKSVTGSIEMVMQHDEVDTEFVGVGLPIAAAMGAVAWSAGEDANQITLASNPAEPVTFAFEKTVGIHEIVGTMFKGFTISGASGQDIRCALDCIAYNYLITGQENASSDLSSLPTVEPSRWLFGDITFEMSTSFANALGTDSDQIAISSFSLNYDAGMSDPEFATPLNAVSDPYGTSALLTMKPERNAFREVTLDLTVPRYTANTWLTAYQNDSPIQAKMTISSSATRRAFIHLPFMKIISIDTNISGPDFIPINMTLKCFRGATYSAGTGNAYSYFTDGSTLIDEEFGIETENDRTAAIFT